MIEIELVVEGERLRVVPHYHENLGYYPHVMLTNLDVDTALAARLDDVLDRVYLNIGGTFWTNPHLCAAAMVAIFGEAWELHGGS